MNFGTWYLAASGGGEVEASGTLHPLGACDLHRRLSSGAGGAAAVVIDAADFDNGLMDLTTFYEILAHVRKVGGQIVVVDEKGPMSHFLGGVGLRDRVPVVRSLPGAWEMIRDLAVSRACAIALEKQEDDLKAAAVGVRTASHPSLLHHRARKKRTDLSMNAGPRGLDVRGARLLPFGRRHSVVDR
jgi:hypothetical protein